MARFRTGEVRVYGPYRHRNKWRVLVRQDGETVAQLLETEAEALATIRKVKRDAKANASKVLDEAIEMYELYLRHDKGNKRTSVDATVDRLRAFFPDVELMANAVRPAAAQAYYDAYRTRLGVLTKRPPSVDTHRNVLSEVKTFYNWCVKKQFAPANPFQGVEGVGRRQHGKPQLRIDESRRWLKVALAEAEQGHVGAVAAMLTLILGMRAGEVVSRVVRDVDDDGKLLWIPAAKTPAGKRTLEVPSLLQPYLRRLVKGRKPEARLFGDHWRDWPRMEVVRICKKAKVPEVCAHSMRGLHSTLAVRAGITGHVVAQALGHESFATTIQSYAQPEAVSAAQQQAVLRVLEGGRK